MLDGVGNLASNLAFTGPWRRAPKLISGEALYVARGMPLTRFGIVHLRINDPASATMGASGPKDERSTMYLTPCRQAWRGIQAW